MQPHFTDLIFGLHYIAFTVFYVRMYIAITGKNVKMMPDYVSMRKDIAVISGASAATASLTGQKCPDKVAHMWLCNIFWREGVSE